MRNHVWEDTDLAIPPKEINTNSPLMVSDVVTSSQDPLVNPEIGCIKRNQEALGSLSLENQISIIDGSQKESLI